MEKEKRFFFATFSHGNQFFYAGNATTSTHSIRYIRRCVCTTKHLDYQTTRCHGTPRQWVRVEKKKELSKLSAATASYSSRRLEADKVYFLLFSLEKLIFKIFFFLLSPSLRQRRVFKLESPSNARMFRILLKVWRCRKAPVADTCYT